MWRLVALTIVLPRVVRAHVQDAAWFDKHPASQLPTMVATLMAQIQDGM
jgi:hypothetical protein